MDVNDNSDELVKSLLESAKRMSELGDEAVLAYHDRITRPLKEILVKALVDSARGKREEVIQEIVSLLIKEDGKHTKEMLSDISALDDELASAIEKALRQKRYQVSD